MLRGKELCDLIDSFQTETFRKQTQVAIESDNERFQAFRRWEREQTHLHNVARIILIAEKALEERVNNAYEEEWSEC